MLGSLYCLKLIVKCYNNNQNFSGSVFKSHLADKFDTSLKISNTNLQEVTEQETLLNHKTQTFFGRVPQAKWKAYPKRELRNEYIGHQVYFFTMAVADEAKQAKDFTNSLKEEGFTAKLSQVKDNPSIIVDLSTSKPVLKY